MSQVYQIFGNQNVGNIANTVNSSGYNNSDLAQAAREIKALLDELSEQYNPATSKGQNLIKEEAIEAIKTNPTLRQRTISAIRSAGDEILAEVIQHPVARVVVAGVKGFLLPDA
jgi:flagellin-like hook-associated protein FlgL